jgi:hypothetical protein
MGASGPIPSPNSITRHKPKQRRRTLKAGLVTIPDLPDDYRPETVAWWQTWIDSSQAEFFADTDWQTLRRCAALVDMFYTAPTAQLAAEVRQIESKLGATQADRDRLGWTTEPPAEPAVAKPKARTDPRRAA